MTTMKQAPLTSRPAWKALVSHVSNVRDLHLRALFADEPAAWDAAKLACKAVAGRSLGAAVAAPEVSAVLDEYDLLWYAPEELDQL